METILYLQTLSWDFRLRNIFTKGSAKRVLENMQDFYDSKRRDPYCKEFVVKENFDLNGEAGKDGTCEKNQN